MDKGSERPWTPGPLYTTIPKLIAHMRKDCGLHSYALARLGEIETLCDTERAKSKELYEALEGVLHLVSAVSREEVAALNAARAALAKANPKEGKQNG